MSDQCAKNAGVLRDVSLRAAHGIFWGMFVATLTLMIIAASCYGSKARHESIFKTALNDPEEAPEITKLERNLKQSQLRCLSVSIMCCLIQMVTIVFESLAGLSLHYCHHEDLIMFLWSTWSLLSLGSFVATLGIAISLFRTRNPPWNIPLGTPVLVFAGLGHIFVDWWRNTLRKQEDYQFPHANNLPYASHRSTRVVMAMRNETADRFLENEGAQILHRGPDFTTYFFDRLPANGEPMRISPNDLELPQLSSNATSTAKPATGISNGSSQTLNERQIDDDSLGATIPAPYPELLSRSAAVEASLPKPSRDSTAGS